MAENEFASYVEPNLEEVITDFLSDEPVPVMEDPVVEVVEEGEKMPLAESPTEVVSTEVVVPVIPLVPVIAEDIPGDELDALRKQNESLLAMIEKLSENGGKKEEVVAAVPVKVLETPIVEAPPLELGEFDYDEIMESKEAFTKFMSRVMGVAKEQAKQEMLTSIPQVVGSFVQRQASMKDVATAFYDKYPELKRVKRYVSTVANEVQAENPGMTIEGVLEEAAKRAKETLQIQSMIQTEDKKSAGKPSLPGGSKGSRSGIVPSTGLQKEIDELIND